MGESDEESDEGLELTSYSMKQDIDVVAGLVEEVGERANTIRDDLNPQHNEGTEGVAAADTLLEKIQEVRERLTEKRPGSWREDRCSPTAGLLTDEDGSGRQTPPVVSSGPTTAELEAALQAMKVRKADGTTPLGSPRNSSSLQEIAVLNAKVEELTAKLAESVKPPRENPATAELKQKLLERDNEINDLSVQITEVQEIIRAEFKTDLKALRMENEDLRAEREDLDRQIISLKLDKEEAEHRIEALQKEGCNQQTADEIRAEVKKAERARIGTAAAQLKKELEQRNQQKIAEVEKQLLAEAEAQRTVLENKIVQLEGQLGGQLAAPQGNASESKLHALQATNMRERRERRRLQNKLAELLGAVKVLCRVRPSLAEGNGDDSRCIISFPEPNTMTISDSGETYHSFEFAHVFGPESTQLDIFNELAPSVTVALDGFHLCVFTHGQQGSGKTYSMVGDNENQGMVGRTIQRLFDDAGEREKKNWRYSYGVSMVEVSEGGVKDVLNNRELVENYGEGSKREGSEQEVLSAIHEGYSKVAGGHTILTIFVDGHNNQLCFSSAAKVHLVDLADTPPVEPSFLTQQSHCYLSNVVADIRTSGGSVVLLSCVSPCMKDVSATLSALSFAAKSSEVEFGKPKKNVSRYRSETH